jgi:hypothetical protein
MTLEQTVLEALRVLPVEKQCEVLDFAQFLQSKTATKKPRRSAKGLCADLGVHITTEEIDETRKAVWGGEG